MSKNTSIWVLIIILILIVGGVYIGNNSKDSFDVMEGNDAMMIEDEDSMMNDEDSMMQEDGDKMMDDGEAMMKSGSYETYSPEKLALADIGDVVLFFRASWCPTCRTLDADIKSHLGDIPENVAILDVNYDTSTALKQKYGVTYQHTLVQVDSAGNQIAKWSGSPTLASLLTNIK